MNHSWETTTDDVANVLQKHGIQVGRTRLEQITNNLDTDEIDDAALKGDDIEEQTEAAYSEIERQLREGGVIT